MAVVALQPVSRRAGRVGALVAPDAERAQPEPYPRLGRVDPLADLLDERVHIGPSPVAPGLALAVARVAGVVVELVPLRVRVEEVVEVHAVEVVAVDRVEDRVLDVRARRGVARVEVETAVGRALGERHRPVRVLAQRMVRRELVEVGTGTPGGRRLAAAVRVEPGVELEVAGVRFLDHPAHRVPTRVLAAFAGQPLRPRRVRGRPERVTAGPDVHEHRVVVHLLGQVEPAPVFGLHLVFGQPGLARKVDVADRGEPHAAQLPLGDQAFRRADGQAGCTGHVTVGLRFRGAIEQTDTGRHRHRESDDYQPDEQPTLHGHDARPTVRDGQRSKAPHKEKQPPSGTRTRAG